MLRIIVAMFIGLLVLEIMIELSAGVTLMGTRDGLFISRPKSVLGNAKVVHTKERTKLRVVKATDIREIPSLKAARVGKLPVGETFTAIGKTTVDGELWYKVQRFGGKIGYIPGNAVVRR